ncbi:pimeloyl-CoA dehydrogenase small subunit [Marinobacterium maritimum]|uniref:Pimeloyl-CoA dehydrogenase small subunit n=1 Tax=Marinobacterium maritimum TaxID=500162 RepID=A0ABP3TAN1_9GAMM
MNFSLTEEQQMLQDSAARFIGQNYSFERRQKDTSLAQGFDPELWRQIAELGWLSVPFSQQNGGFDGDATDLMVLMEQFGKGLVALPYLPTILLFGRLLDLAGINTSYSKLLGQVIEGNIQGSLAFMERQARYQLSDVKTEAVRSEQSFVITGEKALVLNGPNCDKLIVSARTSGGQYDEEGISLFLVDANASGLSRTDYRLMDGQTVANFYFDQVKVPTEQLIGQEGKGLMLLKRVIDQALLGTCAEALGLMHRLTDTTIEYSKVRKQFGVTIGSFQALQHRMVDMFTACEQTRSLLFRAVCSAASMETNEHQKNLHALKVLTGRNGKAVGNEAIQLHGGMGLTDELDVGHGVKRLMVINSLFGDADFHQQKMVIRSLEA